MKTIEQGPTCVFDAHLEHDATCGIVPLALWEIWPTMARPNARWVAQSSMPCVTIRKRIVVLAQGERS